MTALERRPAVFARRSADGMGAAPQTRQVFFGVLGGRSGEGLEGSWMARNGTTRSRSIPNIHAMDGNSVQWCLRSMGVGAEFHRLNSRARSGDQRSMRASLRRYEGSDERKPSTSLVGALVLLLIFHDDAWIREASN